MTITSRATRKTDLALARTDVVNGPGAHNLVQERSKRQNFTGFGNSEPRGSIANVDPRASRLPGPGTYNLASTSGNPEVSSADGANFKSTSRRLAPTVTGSSAYMASTIAENPGPGTYDGVSSMKAAIKNGVRAESINFGLKRAKSVTKILEKMPLQYNPPAIPQKMQTFGYYSDDSQGFRNVQPVPPPSQIIMGTEKDAVGPGAYEQFIGKGIKPDLPSSFAHSRTQRNFLQNAGGSDVENPGPGDYEGRGFNWNRGGAVGGFRSKTKMAYQMRDPAEKEAMANSAARDNLMSAQSGKRGQATANFGRHGEEYVSTLDNSNDKYNLVQSFGTTAKRDTCPKVHDKAIPFASRSNTYSEQQVGPGSYNTDSTSSFNVKKQRTLRSDPVGFLGTAQRPCLKTSDSRQSLSAPGPSPAQYNPSYYTMEFQAKKSALSSRKIGVFGTTGPRFRPKNNIEEEAERTEFNVGPGSYEHETMGFERQQVQKVPFVSAFKKQERFIEGKDINRGGGGFLVTGNKSGPPPVSLPSDFNMRDDDTVELHKKAIRPSFGSSAPRTSMYRNIDGSKFKDTPGPQYVSKVHNMAGVKKSLVHGGKPRNREPSTFTKAGRAFDTGSSMSVSLGPGSYTLPGSMSSRSFNITMKAKRKQYVKRSTYNMLEADARRREAVKQDDASSAMESMSIAGDHVST